MKLQYFRQSLDFKQFFPGNYQNKWKTLSDSTNQDLVIMSSML